MELHVAIEVLENYQRWRIGDIENVTNTISPSIVTEAINVAITNLKNNNTQFKIPKVNWQNTPDETMKR